MAGLNRPCELLIGEKLPPPTNGNKPFQDIFIYRLRWVLKHRIFNGVYCVILVKFDEKGF